MLSGLLYPTSGEATVLGFTPWKRQNAFKRQFSLILGQKNQLWWDLPASESLELNRVIYGIDRAEAQRTIDELTALLDVREKLDVMVRELSLGERMKMELIAALLHRPKVLFLDEPTIGLDVVSQKRVRDFLREYTTRYRITTLLTSHYMQDIEELCERVIIIDRGQVFFDGALQDVIDRLATHKMMTLVRRKGFAGADLTAYGEVLERNDNEVKLKIPRAKIVAASQTSSRSCRWMTSPWRMCRSRKSSARFSRSGALRMFHATTQRTQRKTPADRPLRSWRRCVKLGSLICNR